MLNSAQLNAKRTEKKQAMAKAMTRRASIEGTRIRLFIHSIKLNDSDAIDTLPTVAIHSHSFARLVIRCANENEANSLFDRVRSLLHSIPNASRGLIQSSVNAWMHSDNEPLNDPLDIEPTMAELMAMAE